MRKDYLKLYNIKSLKPFFLRIRQTCFALFVLLYIADTIFDGLPGDFFLVLKITITLICFGFAYQGSHKKNKYLVIAFWVTGSILLFMSAGTWEQWVLGTQKMTDV